VLADSQSVEIESNIHTVVRVGDWVSVRNTDHLPDTPTFSKRNPGAIG